MTTFGDWRALVLAAALVPAGLTAAEAAKIQVTFGGAVTDVYDNDGLFGAQVVKGTSFTGSFIYDQARPNTDGRPNFGFYQGAVSNFKINFGNGFAYQQNKALPYNNVQLGNDRADYGLPLFDGFYAYGQVDGFNGYDYSEIGITLESLNLAALLDNSLPDQLVDNDFLPSTDGVPKQGTGVEFHAVGGTNDNGYDFTAGEHVYGTLRYLTTTPVLVPVPEPASGALLAVALLGIAGLTRRAAADARIGTH